MTDVERKTFCAALSRYGAEEIKEIPAADVAPVRHAHRVDNGAFYYSCSECGDVLTYGGNYCHNCGAELTERK